MSDPNAGRLEITCPCCEAKIIVDRTTGTILRHDAKADPKGSGSISDIMQGLAAKYLQPDKGWKLAIVPQTEGQPAATAATR